MRAIDRTGASHSVTILSCCAARGCIATEVAEERPLLLLLWLPARLLLLVCRALSISAPSLAHLLLRPWRAAYGTVGPAGLCPLVHVCTRAAGEAFLLPFDPRRCR